VNQLVRSGWTSSSAVALVVEIKAVEQLAPLHSAQVRRT
jgi:hypothetical protein